MLQITGIRSFVRDGETIKYDGAFFDEKWRAQSIQDLFENLDHYVNLIPLKERYNIFFTAVNCTNKKREFQSASCIWFDIDGIDTTQIDSYIEVFCTTLKLKREETGIVLSGRGLHFYVGLQVPIVDKKFFTETKDHYREILHALGKGFKDASLPYKTDPSVYTPRQLMRLPGTTNRKPERGADVEAKLIQTKIVPIQFDITILSGLPRVSKDEHIDAKSLKEFAPDSKAIFQGCEFLRYCKENPDAVNEPEWYAALSVTARMDKGREISHDLSKGHPGYVYENTERKIDQALAASGPRTCKNIQGVWGSCGQCKNWEKITSPILLRGEDEIKTEKTGFFHLHYDPKTGGMKRGEPDYEGLLKFFERKHPFASTEETVWIWNGTHFTEMSDDTLKHFPQAHFKPICRNTMVNEFVGLVYRSNVWTPEDWTNANIRRINFKNGVLDLDKGDLVPHDMKFGFKYCLPYDYTPDADCPQFKKFLGDVTGSDKVLIQTLLEFGGYILAGDDCKYEKALMLEGSGSNGKSTFIECLKAVTGRQAYSTLSVKEIEALDRRAALDGVLYNITEETPSRFWDTPTFKNLISGGELQVRRLYKNSYNMRNRAKLIFSCNELPLSSDSTLGFFRKFLIVPFHQTFSRANGNIDIHIRLKLKAELPGIFNMFLLGWKKLEAQGHFTKVDQGDKELEEYKSLSDPIKYWFEECIEVSPPHADIKISITDLFTSYKVFLEESGYEKRIEPKNIFWRKFKKMLPDFDARWYVTTKDNKSIRAIRGLKASLHADKEF